MNKISIVIPCRNEANYIFGCIASVLNSDYPKELLEILVCDGRSDDGTQNIIHELSVKHSCIKYIENKEKITSAGLNMGIKNAVGDIIMILGAHAEIFPDYISKCVDILSRNPEIGCTGGVLVNLTVDNSSEAIALAMSSPFGVGDAHFRTGNKDGYVDTVAFGAYKKEVFDKIGLFDEALVRNQDDELNYRLLKSGYKIFLSTDIKAKYYVRSSLNKLFTQYYQYGYWKVFVNMKLHSITTFRQLAPLLFVLFIITGTVASMVSPIFFTAFIGTIGIYIMIGLISAMNKTKNPLIVFKILLSFIVLHLSYGLGYLEGIFLLFIFGGNPGKTKK